MANSKYEYVKKFENNDSIGLNTFIVVRVDGRSFHKFTKLHSFQKPNDEAGIYIMNEAAKAVMVEFPDLVLAYGQSDEFSFLFHRNTRVYQRRSCKLISAIVSLFSSAYVYHWNTFKSSVTLKYPPSFDARAISYPSVKNVRDYFCWRQVDCHINNLYNTCFWKLVSDGSTEIEAEKLLNGTFSNDKNELLFQRGINYNNISDIYKKGSVLYRSKSTILVEYVDLIKDNFWTNSGLIKWLEKE